MVECLIKKHDVLENDAVNVWWQRTDKLHHKLTKRFVEIFDVNLSGRTSQRKDYSTYWNKSKPKVNYSNN